MLQPSRRPQLRTAGIRAATFSKMDADKDRKDKSETAQKSAQFRVDRFEFRL